MKKKLQFCTVIKFGFTHLTNQIYRKFNRKLLISTMFANINECISLNCITPTSSGTTRTASAFRCCLTIICSWANLKEVGYTIFEFEPCLNPTLVQTISIRTLKQYFTWYRHWTWIGSVFPWKLNDSKVNLSSPFGPRSRISKVSSRIHPSLINFHVGKFESYKRFFNF